MFQIDVLAGYYFPPLLLVGTAYWQSLIYIRKNYGGDTSNEKKRINRIDLMSYILTSGPAFGALFLAVNNFEGIKLFDIQTQTSKNVLFVLFWFASVGVGMGLARRLVSLKSK